MLGRLNHVAIAVPDLARGTEVYRSMLGARVSAPQAEPTHGVTVVFVELPNTKIEPYELLMISLIAAATFAILDLFAPSIGSSVRTGAGFGIGANLVGFPGNIPRPI